MARGSPWAAGTSRPVMTAASPRFRPGTSARVSESRSQPHGVEGDEGHCTVFRRGRGPTGAATTRTEVHHAYEDRTGGSRSIAGSGPPRWVRPRSGEPQPDGNGPAVLVLRVRHCTEHAPRLRHRGLHARWHRLRGEWGIGRPCEQCERGVAVRHRLLPGQPAPLIAASTPLRRWCTAERPILRPSV